MRFGRVGVGALLLTVLVLAGCSGPGRSLYAGPRPADACTMLTSAEVEDVVGTPGPFTGAHEDPDQNGAPVWGCTWGTQQSYVDLREISPDGFTQAGSAKDMTMVALPGIGDKALLAKGRGPYLVFAAAGHDYEVEVTVDRHPTPVSYDEREAEAAQTFATIFTAR